MVDELANAKIIYAYFEPLIGSNGAVAAVVNAFCESSLSPSAVGDHHEAYGLFQLHPDRIAPLKTATGIDIEALPDVVSQCKAIWHEMQTSEKHALSGIKAAATPADATQEWCQLYERPASKTEPARRASLAAGWMTKLGLTA